MKEYQKTETRSDVAQVEAPETPDQEELALTQSDALSNVCNGLSDALLNDIGISLPSASLAERKVAVKSKGHFCGHLVVGDCEEQVIAVESHLEMNCALILSARSDVIELREQVGFPWVDDFGGHHVHFFDFVVTLRDASRIAIFVKPFKFSQKQKFVSEARQIVPQVTSAFADKVVLMTDRHIDPIELYNAELLHSVRLSDPEVDLKAKSVVQSLQGSATVADLVNEISIPGQGFRAVVRLIRNNILELVHSERIAPSTMLRRRAA